MDDNDEGHRVKRFKVQGFPEVLEAILIDTHHSVASILQPILEGSPPSISSESVSSRT